MNVLKSTSSIYVQNMIENMVLMSFLDKLYFVARQGGYVANIQIMSSDKFKHQEDFFVAPHNFHVASVATLYHDHKTAKCDAAISVFSVCLPVKYCDMLHQFFCIRRVYCKTLTK